MPKIKVTKKNIKIKLGGTSVYPDLENIEITPSKEIQEFNHSERYGYDKVTVLPIPEEYIIPTGTLDITENGEHNVKTYEKVNVDVTGGYGVSVENTTLIFDNGISVSENEVIL